MAPRRTCRPRPWRARPAAPSRGRRAGAGQPCPRRRCPGARRAEVPVGEAGAAVELDLAVLEARIEVEQDHQAVVDAGTPDAPLVHQRCSVASASVGRDVVAPEGLRVDHDLGLRLRLDGVDDRLGLALRRRREDVGVVVDGLAVDRSGEGRPGAGAGGRRRAGDAGQQSASDRGAAAGRRGVAIAWRASWARVTDLARRVTRRHPSIRGRPAGAAGGRCRSRRATRRTRRRRRWRRGRRDGATAGRACRGRRSTRRWGLRRVSARAPSTRRRAVRVDRPAQRW